MAIGFPNDRVWQAANWVVRGFCDDARPLLAEFPLLAERIEENYLHELWSFQIEDDPAELDEMARLVDRVIADNQVSQGAGFRDPSSFPVYLGKLRDLARLVAEARAGGSHRPAPAGARTVDRGRIIVGEGLHVASGRGVFRGHLAEDPQQKRLVTQAELEGTTAVDLARRHSLAVDGIAPLEYAGPVDQPDRIGWNGECIVEIEPRGRPSIELAPISEAAALPLARDLVDVVARAHQAGQVVGGIRPELIYVREDVDRRPRLAGLAPRGPLFLAQARPASSGSPPFTRLYSAVHDPDLEPPGDLFALCLSLVHLVSGRHPYGDDYQEQLRRMMTGEREPWPGSQPLGAALLAGLEMDPARRPTAAALLARLRGL